MPDSNRARPGQALLPAMQRLPPHLHLPFLALMEQRAKQDADLAALRALRDYRKMLLSPERKDQ